MARSSRKFAVSIEWARTTAQGYYAAGRTAEQFHAFVMAEYGGGLSAQRMLNAWWRLEKGL